MLDNEGPQLTLKFTESFVERIGRRCAKYSERNRSGSSPRVGRHAQHAVAASGETWINAKNEHVYEDSAPVTT